MKSVIVTYGQTLMDIAIQEYGCFEGVILLMRDNDMKVTEVLLSGQPILIRDSIPEITPTNLSVIQNQKLNKVWVNSGYAVDVSITMEDAPKVDYLHLAEGPVLNIDYGVWTSGLPLVYTVTWFRNFVPVAASGVNYVPTLEDDNKLISAIVTVSNEKTSTTIHVQPVLWRQVIVDDNLIPIQTGLILTATY